jgi:hypothetical protein
MAPHIFLSYSRADRGLAADLHGALKRRQLSVWRDTRRIPVGDRWSDAIERGIREARAVVVLLTKSSVKSHWVMFEQAFARGARIPVLPVIARGTQIPPSIAQFEALKLGDRSFEDVGDGLHEAIRRIAKQVGHKRADDARGPAVVAKFMTRNGRVVRRGEDELKSLAMEMWVDDAPRETTSVRFEILDDGFDDNPWTVTRQRSQLREFLTKAALDSWGDCEIWAAGSTARGRRLWVAKTTLYEALSRYYQEVAPGRDEQRALKQIKAN